MGTSRIWYNNGKIEPINSGGNSLSCLLSNFNGGLHIIWRTSGSRIPFFKEQFSLLVELLNLNQITPQDNFDEIFLRECITQLINRNRIFKGSLTHIIFIPQNLSGNNKPCALFISTEDWHEEKFILNSRGLRLGLIKGHSHPGAWLLPRIGSNHHIHKLWDNEQKTFSYDAAYFTNQSGKIIECTNDCIFVISGNRLYTPSADMGICPRAIRNVILSLAETLELEAVETDQLEPAHLNAADEAFIANDQNGIRWIVGHNGIRYFKKYSEMFNALINSEWAKAD